MLRRLVMAVFWVTLVLDTLIVAGLGFATIQWLKLFNDAVTLPNDLVLKREFDFTFLGRDDMFASDGKTLLARDIEGVCFDDSYILVYAYDRRQSGLFDVLTEKRVSSDQDSHEVGLTGRDGCNGYFTGMLGPGLLYDGAEAPHLPPCSWRNLDRPGLADRSWFGRPCVEDDWPERRGKDDGRGDLFHRDPG